MRFLRHNEFSVIGIISTQYLMFLEGVNFVSSTCYDRGPIIILKLKRPVLQGNLWNLGKIDAHFVYHVKSRLRYILLRSARINNHLVWVLQSTETKHFTPTEYFTFKIILFNPNALKYSNHILYLTSYIIFSLLTQLLQKETTF